MRVKFVILLVAVLFALGAFIAFHGVYAQIKAANTAADQQQIEKLLREFLSRVDDPAMHDRFWADDLLYTGSSGALRTKAEILKNVREAASRPADPKEPKTTFDAEDVIVHTFGDFAVINFKLVGHTEADGKPHTLNFRNTGTFRKQNGEWKVVGWQATRMEEKKPEEKK
jgi:ketosteroid isomerase-like protein